MWRKQRHALWGLPSLADLGTLQPSPCDLIWTGLLENNRSCGTAELAQFRPYLTNESAKHQICERPFSPSWAAEARRATILTGQRLTRNNKMLIVVSHKIFGWFVIQQKLTDTRTISYWVLFSSSIFIPKSLGKMFGLLEPQLPQTYDLSFSSISKNSYSLISFLSQLWPLQKKGAGEQR